MDSRATLARAKALLKESEDDSLARAALAVQQSEYGAARRIDAIIASLNDLPAPRIAPVDINGIRSIVLRETGLNIALDDPILLLLVATQDVGMSQLEAAVGQLRRKRLGRLLNEVAEETCIAMINDWALFLTVYAIGMATGFLLLPSLVHWLP